MMNSENPWAADFGRSYVDRNKMTWHELDKLYQSNFGISRSVLNKEFLSGFSQISTILEVGCNIGLQLEVLWNQGYSRLYGFDISSYAIGLVTTRIQDANVVRSSALDFPFKNKSFDLVFSSGVLIHIRPNDLNLVLDEMYRCSKRYIWCFEYFAEKETEIPYRGKKGLLWKNNFLKLFTQRYPDLSIVQTRKLKYTYNDNTDIMFLLRKHTSTDDA